MAMSRKDIRPVARPELSWDTANCQESLGTIYKRAEAYALGAKDWYLNSKRTKKRAAQGLRLVAIGLTGVIGV